MPDGDELLRLALSRPVEALAEASRLIAGGVGGAAGSVAFQARAIVLRDEGRFGEAIRALRTGLRLARASGDRDRALDVQATLGVTLAMSGRTATGLAVLDEVVAASRGQLAGRALMRRGYQLAAMGRREEALADLNRSIALLHRAGDGVWEARARTSRFGVYATFGQAARAHRDLAEADRLFRAAGSELESVTAVHNRADLAAQSGDLPAALAFLDEAEQRYSTLGSYPADLVFDRCKVLLAAGLAAEALEAADAGLARLGRRTSDTAELQFVSARAAHLAGRPDEAARRAARARDLFRAQHRPWWAARAAFVLVQARYDGGRRDGRLRAAAGRIADRLDALGAEEAPAADLLAGRLAAVTGRLADAERHLERAARSRSRGPSYGRAGGWLAQALRAEARGATRAALSACRRGLVAASDHQRRLGAVELRAYAAGYGTELAALGQRHAVRRNDARALLAWSERWRAGALSHPSPRPADDTDLAADLTMLRAVIIRLDAARAAGEPATALEQRRRSLEAAIRARTRRVSGDRPRSSASAAADVLDGLGDRLLLELVVVDGVLHVVTVRNRRVRLHTTGPAAIAVREVELARFMLRRLARGRTARGATDALVQAGRRLQSALLGPAAAEVGGAEVVIVPPGALHAVPWAMLPVLRDESWTVAPSAAVWLRAVRQPVRRRGRAVVVVGPGLAGARAEAARIATGYRDAVLLDGGRATAARVLAAVDGARVAHIAAHGVFRADNPLFSSVRLDDGPLTVYDLGRLRRAPDSMILASCESGVAATVAGDELLGMISVLAPLGTASLVAGVVPVNDAAAAPLMAAVHAGLRPGDSLGPALARARRATWSGDDDPVTAATALAFVALGR
ncbi:CHAT domain-containing protein [Catenuloplanes sp. NPDC051500]|uniref:CHAT domain-containing protein n=1 Tax=Catenuloplanes sp. NPDC051500 TaxID=3363959 RepID=UPI0037A0BA70